MLKASNWAECSVGWQRESVIGDEMPVITANTPPEALDEDGRWGDDLDEKVNLTMKGQARENIQDDAPCRLTIWPMNCSQTNSDAVAKEIRCGLNVCCASGEGEYRERVATNQ